MSESGCINPEDGSTTLSFWSNKPRFFWFALISSTVLTGIFAFQLIEILRQGGTMASPGWTASASVSGWTINQVQRAGPAAGKLKRGDKLLAMDGDAKAAASGPNWFLSHKAPAEQYTIEIQRGADRLALPLSMTSVNVPGQRLWASLQFLVALIFLTTGTIIGLAKPANSAARSAYLSAAFSAMFLLSIASVVMRSGGIHGFALWITLGLDCAFGVHYLFGYRFYSRFPYPVTITPVWAVCDYLIAAFAIGLWALGVGFNVLDGLPTAVSASFAISNRWITSALIWGADTSTRKLFVALINVAIAAVCIRNYRLIPEGDQRRRLRWAFFGVIATAVPSFAIMAFWYIVTRLPNAMDLQGLRFFLSRSVNLIAVTMPLTMVYAIMKHRVMGISVVIRTGLQYLLARNVLRLLFILPFAALVYEFFAGHDKTIGQLVLEGGAKWNLLLAVCFAAGNRYRRQLTTTIDKRFFREAYDQEAILTVLADSIKNLDSIEAIAELISSEISNALHPGWVAVLYRQTRQSGLSMAYASDETSRRLQAAGLAGILEQLEYDTHARNWSTLRAACPHQDRIVFDGAGANLLVPISGTEHRLIGVVVLGEKKSEEPYTAKDRALLERVGHEAGIVYENLELRGQVRRERQVQADVLARIADHNLNLVRECPSCGRCFDSSAGICSVDHSELSLSLPVERTIDGRYRLERLIGKGGMGAVYEATDLRLNRVVAVKVMTGRLFGNAAAMRRFSREAQTSARLVHPNIVRLYDYGELAAEGAFLVLEYLRGVTLRKMLTDCGTLTPEFSAQLFDQLFAGMESAHQAKIIHRDLKPDNIIVCGSGGEYIVKILDFGLAKMRDPDLADYSSMTAPGVAVGTIGYMSPEQYIGRDVDERTDIYAIGVMALETLTGRLQLQTYSFHTQIVELAERRFTFAGSTGEHQRVVSCIQKCVALQRSDRYATIAELRDEFLPALRACPPLPGIERAAAASSTIGDNPDPTATLLIDTDR